MKRKGHSKILEIHVDLFCSQGFLPRSVAGIVDPAGNNNNIRNTKQTPFSRN